MTTTDRSQQLRQLVELINTSSQTLLAEWDADSKKPVNKGLAHSNLPEVQRLAALPSPIAHRAINTLLGASGMIPELVQDPGERLLELAGEYFEARALHIAAKLRISDLLDAAGPKGMTKEELGKATGLEKGKLARIMRLLATIHCFKEIGPDTWTNNRISQALVKNEPLRAYLYHYGEEPYRAADALMFNLDDPVKGHSYDILDAAFSDVYGPKPRWEWLEEKDENGKPREQLERFGLAMLGAGRVVVPGTLADFPWAELDNAKVVDVGGGVGAMCMALASVFPNLSFTLQDRPEVIGQAMKIWSAQYPQFVEQNRIQFMPHDFFKPQPILDADVYWIRYIAHDWSDSFCIDILKNLKPALEGRPDARLLIADQIMVTAYGSDLLPKESRAPEPLPANFGAPARFSHERDINMCALLNGIERTPAEFEALAEAAGLRVERFWLCRSVIGLVEVRCV
ncbi:unnamed protein product [Tilletia controversa]|nr:unnamed protein product [Tilletia controversa]